MLHKSSIKKPSNSHSSKKHLRLLTATIVALTIAVIGSYFVLHNGSRQPKSNTISTANAAKPTHWLMTGTHIKMLKESDPQSADYFFNTPDAFSMGPTSSGLNVTAVKVYTSYATFSNQITFGNIPNTTQWVMYDNETWNKTPKAEAQHPARFMKSFAELAHAHNLKVIEAPALNLASVRGADCESTRHESARKAYLHCDIPADARFADVYEIQAQAEQHNVARYEKLIAAAKSQIDALSPGIVILAGLTTDRGDSASQIFACWQASHNQVSGYWMNSNIATFPVAQQTFDSIRQAGGN